MKELHNRNFGIAFTILAFFTYTCGNEDQSIHAFLKERLTGSFYSAMFTSDEKRQIYHLKISGEADTRQVLELLKTRGFEIQGKGDALVFLYEKRISKTGGDEVIDSIIDSDIYFTQKRIGRNISI